MTYNEIRNILRAQITIPTLGGRTNFEIINPSFGDLTATNSKNNAYRITETDWYNARTIRSHHSRNPWATQNYNELSAYFSYSLIYAAALLRYVEEGGVSNQEIETAKLSAA